MATGLLVLKIIGLILLGILGLILALILAVLLVPVRYRAEASYYDEARAKAEVSWLLHIISCRAVYDGELDFGVRIFGFRLGGKEAADGDTGESGDPGDAGDLGEESPRDEKSADEGSPGQKAVKEVWNLPEEGQNSRNIDGAGEAGKTKTLLEEESTRNTEPAQESKNAQETQETRQADLEAEILAELKEEQQNEERAGRRQKKKMPFSFQKICDKLKQTGEQKDRAAEFLKNEENKETFRLLKRQVKALFRHILPGKMRGKVKFGFDDPYTTGQVLMYISPFYGIYGKRFQVIPVFEEPVLEGEAWLKGRIRIGTVLAIGIRMLFDKNFRTLLRKWRK